MEPCVVSGRRPRARSQTGVLLVRIGDQRFLGKNAAFDVIFGVILGSVLGRAIAPPISIVGALVAGAVLVGLHWVFAVAAFRRDWFGRLIKGDSHLLVQHGSIRWNAMRRHHISEKDLVCALRTNAAMTDPGGVGLAYLERSGDVSVIRAASAPRVVHIQVAAGVQTVRIELA
ncbi:MAG TPA: YetF domain-containing protein [Methylomirabilota bacterium]|nr:YetF domain-containing protein [Methylomirabilota bacterium]